MSLPNLRMKGIPILKLCASRHNAQLLRGHLRDINMYRVKSHPHTGLGGEPTTDNMSHTVQGSTQDIGEIKIKS